LTLVCVVSLSLFTLFLVEIILFWCLLWFGIVVSYMIFSDKNLEIFIALLYFPLCSLCYSMEDFCHLCYYFVYCGCLFLRIHIKIHVFQDFSLIL
jgi:hypothetical protein